MNTRRRKPSLVTMDKGVRPGGGRAKQVHSLPLLPLEPPAGLTADEAKLYREIASSVAYAQLAAIDLPLLQVFIVHVLIHRRAATELAALEDMAVTTRNSMRAHPLAGIVVDQARVILTLASELGLTPTSRCRLKLPAGPVSSAWDNISG